MTQHRQKQPTYEPAVWRLVQTGILDGPTNMAIDEALLEAVLATESLPVLRIYSWEPPCLSIGRDQDWDIIELDICAQKGWDVVRRPTIGRSPFT
jgi:lipoate-protein ligase A